MNRDDEVRTLEALKRNWNIMTDEEQKSIDMLHYKIEQLRTEREAGKGLMQKAFFTFGLAALLAFGTAVTGFYRIGQIERQLATQQNFAERIIILEERQARDSEMIHEIRNYIRSLYERQYGKLD